MTSVSVIFEKRASDGDYGNERVEIRLELEIGEDEDLGQAAGDLLALARRLGEADLKKSASWKVQRSVLRAEEAEISDRGVAWSEANAQSELAAIAAEDEEDLPY